MDWLEISVQADREAVESVSEVLTRFGYGGVVIEEPGSPGPDGDYVVDLAAPITVRAYLPEDDETERRQWNLAEALWHLGRLRPISPPQTRVVREQDWETAWKAHYHPLRVGERIVVVPSWEAYAPGPGEVAVTLDPGMAFGTGTHPTTRLCLTEMERHVQPGMRVLDVGTGSGILAIAAARLGAANVLALDTDPVAVAAAQENVAANGLANVVSVARGTIGSRGEPILEEGSSVRRDGGRSSPTFDLVVANLTAAIVARLASGLVAALGPGGLLIVSGIIDELEDKPRTALDAAGFVLTRRVESDGWIVLVGHS
jgi:ribosomal protein L11 methyltransferase